MPTSDRRDAAAPAFGLIAHAAYACRESGVCCSSDWEIPVEAALHTRIADAIAIGALRPRDEVGLKDRAGLPPGIRSVLGRLRGRCVFHREGPGACTLHAWGGPEAKPVACRQFPWIAVHDPRGTFVSLSHVCPSAAARLDDGAILAIAEMPRPASSFDGLDVRRALPPAIGPRRLMDWDALSAWDVQALDACGRNEAPEAVLRDLRCLLLHARRWTPGQGSLARWIGAWTPDGSSQADRSDHADDGDDASHGDAAAWRPKPALDAIVRAAVPVGLLAPSPVETIPAPAWHASSAIVRRYLAARLVACWPLHYGTGLATLIAYVDALLSVIAGELARRSAASPDASAIRAAIADADRLVVHLAAPDALARGLDAWASAQGDGL